MILETWIYNEDRDGVPMEDQTHKDLDGTAVWIGGYDTTVRKVLDHIYSVAETSYEYWCACYQPLNDARSMPRNGITINLPNGDTIKVMPT